MTLNKEERELLKEAQRQFERELEAEGLPESLKRASSSLPKAFQQLLPKIREAVITGNVDQVPELLASLSPELAALNRGEDDDAITEEMAKAHERVRDRVVNREPGTKQDNDEPRRSR